MKLNLYPVLLLILFIFTFPDFSIAQSAPGEVQRQATITGTIVDKDNRAPLEYATVVLTNTETQDVTGGVTGPEGTFEIEAPAGTYNVRFEYISYKPVVMENQQLKGKRDFGIISLALDVAQLEAVEVTGERTTVEVRLDKKIYNVGKDLTTSGAVITDALQNIPSVAVDVEGNISLRGNENVRILINGRPSALAGFGSTEALRQLPADAIERVEVITSPSARYDAEGTAGILNIILKREKTLGVNGTVNMNIGYPASGQVTSNFNFRTDKFNIFNTLGYSYREPPGNGFFDNQYFQGLYSRIIEDRAINRRDKGFNINLGAEYFITEKQSVTASFFTRLSDEQDNTTNDTQRFIDGDLATSTLRSETENEDDKSWQVSLNYRNRFNDDGHQLTADLQYSYDDEDVNTDIFENNTFPNDLLVAQERVFETEKQDDWLIQADYVLPMGDRQFEAGYRGTFETEVNDYQLDSLDRASGEFVTNLNLTNVFTYTENVNAFYTQYGDKFGKFQVLLGLRLENTQLKGKVESDIPDANLEEELGFDFDTDFDRNYLGLFPTVNLVYEFNERENISLGYNRRINRPRGWFINPFPSRSSRTNIFQGNPDLDPAFANAFDLGYLRRWESITLTGSVYYQRETNSFERIQEDTGVTTPDGINIIRTIPINLSTNQRYGGETGVLWNPSKKLRFNGSFNIFKFITDGFYNGTDFGAENLSYFARFSSKVTLPAKIEWQTNMFYRGPSQNAQTETEGIFSLNLALSKDVLNDNGTLTFNVSDLFNSRKRRSFTVTDQFISDSEFQWRERQFTLSFIYRFNRSKRDDGRGRRGEDYDDDGGEF
ncbi:TonB-dependent receptor domain-containing protein [Robertkochia aurantiaca]|uniref:TonB-dependent receptor domain-containing protein n=1 Tax=Robertkochia aurantiaca TaxID=2873700 RepID=UPI001CCCD67B|nr:TonB-dependent receptor [Robertkochia sp. 3YJGBD-33]